MDSGGGGCPGPAVQGAVEEDLTLALDSVTLLPLLVVKILPGEILGEEVMQLKSMWRFVLLKIIDMALPCLSNPLIHITHYTQPTQKPHKFWHTT